MGSFLTSFYSPTLPIPVKESELIKNDPNAIQQFRNDYRNLGVAILEMDANFWQIAKSYRTTCTDWFTSNNFDTKKKFVSESKDPLFKELGRRPNIGYILTDHKKEYLKFKNTSTNDMFPNNEIYKKFKQLFALWHSAAMTCMNTILSDPVEIVKKTDTKVYSTKTKTAAVSSDNNSIKTVPVSSDNNIDNKDDNNDVDDNSVPIADVSNNTDNTVAQSTAVSVPVSVPATSDNQDNHDNSAQTAVPAPVSSDNADNKVDNQDNDDNNVVDNNPTIPVSSDNKDNDDNKDDNKSNDDNDNDVYEKYDDGMEPMTTYLDRKNIRKFGGIHSSISLIHYFKNLCDKNDEHKLNDNDDKLSNRTTLVPLGKHIDTGLMTFISCSDVAGLEILDRKTNQYYKPEKIFDPNKHIFVIAGRKMELFSWKKVIKPTWHAVNIPLDTDRYSLLYFMEIQKDH